MMAKELELQLALGMTVRRKSDFLPVESMGLVVQISVKPKLN